MERNIGSDGTLCTCGRQLDMLCVYVTPTTGGQFQLRVASTDTVDFLRKLISKRLRVPKERICLLHRDRWVVVVVVGQPPRSLGQWPNPERLYLT